MRLMDYKLFSKEERLKYLRGQKMTTGIPYFGGKSKIGRILYNTIFNMALTMYDNGHKPHIFVDVFTGGGKMGLSIPDGWADIIVMNDIDRGVVGYYRSCQENYRLLIAAVDEVIELMDEDFFNYCLNIRENKELDMYMAGAMTYVCAACSFNNILGRGASYKLKGEAGQEQVELEKIRKRAHRAITKVAKQITRRKYIIENLDYRELIAKYNFKQWTDLDNELHEPISVRTDEKVNVLWYMDPPYHPYCLNGMEDAPYVHTFSYDDVVCMTKILSGEDTTYGEIDYFIKSDYNPKVTVANAKRNLLKIGTSDTSKMSENQKDSYSRNKAILEHEEEMMHDFDAIEDETKGFICIPVGEFDKGALSKTDEVLMKTVGYEYIWCKGLPKGYSDLAKYADK